MRRLPTYPSSILPVFLVAVFLFLRGSALALDVPDLENRVNDYASMLAPSTVSHLERMLGDLEDEKTTQIVVLTIPSLKGQSIESFSLKVAETWQIGQEGLDNGALLVISSGDRKLRIEVGYGLEGRLTDLVCGRIVRHVIVPQFKKGRFDRGVLLGVDAMIKAVRGEFTGTEQAEKTKESKEIALARLVAFFLIAFLAIFRLAMVKPLFSFLFAVIFSFMSAIFSGAFNIKVFLIFLAGGITAALLLPYSLFLVGAGGTQKERGFWRGFTGTASSGGAYSGGFSGGGGGFGGGGASGGW
ncbi:TPM domain-containing protein [Thermodesulfobacteriota bacterium]